MCGAVSPLLPYAIMMGYLGTGTTCAFLLCLFYHTIKNLIKRTSLKEKVGSVSNAATLNGSYVVHMNGFISSG
jgi:hypothetical protein